MLVTVFCAPRDRPETTFALDVSPELELRDFVALCELESGIPAGEIQITYVEQTLKDPTRALGTYGVRDGDVVVLRQADRRPPPTQPAFPGLPHIDFRSITVPGTSSSTSHRGAVRPQQQAPQQQAPQQQAPQQQAPQQQAPQPQASQPQASQSQAPQQQLATQPSTPVAFRGSSPQGLDDPALLQQMLLSNPHELSLLKERNPPLAEALLSGDLERFTKVLLEQQQDRAKREQERIRLLTADPFDIDAQAKIEEDIRQHNVEENMTIAMEEAPESFGQVVMLYINCRVNGHPVKAFVDSGAQMTIMSQACAERCNIMRLVDRRWAGIAKGVGTQKIIGRVHLAQVQIEGDFLPCSFSILEDQPMDMLLGLDMLKRHQCSIDLKKNVVVIGTTGTETRFLPEAELPECARLAYGAEGHEDARPEEIADRELAEALQRSIQESVTDSSAISITNQL
ncbi:protein DDI1 homolog 2 isoform 2-T3 [Odontesthes bonariensis]|uniref:protein DDI1 homolog 2 isoform X2 n=1 Tax=Odontesthes bonariensis TaxID=219752 RepID=UPI003F58E4D2